MRLQDWPERLADYVELRRDVPFSWGGNDCSTFAAGAVEAMTGAAPSVPTAESAQQYAQLLQASGSLLALTTETLGEPIHPAYAQRGDVMLIVIDERETLGVCLGASIAAPGAAGLMTVPIDTATAAWRV